MLEAISMAEQLTDRDFNWTYSNANRTGDHIWWISDISRFRQHYPKWKFTHDMKDIMSAVINGQAARLVK
jgi:CDP-paratose 2-epimerase